MRVKQDQFKKKSKWNEDGDDESSNKRPVSEFTRPKEWPFRVVREVDESPFILGEE